MASYLVMAIDLNSGTILIYAYKVIIDSLHTTQQLNEDSFLI